jgi:DNA-binding NarL/FixJ family response regulator
MPGVKMTYLLCYDEHRNFTEDIRKRFSDAARYKVESFQNASEFMASCREEKEKGLCKVALIGIPDSRESYDSVGEMTQDLKKTDPGIGLILIISPEKVEDLKKAVRFNIDAYIPRNANAVLRIHNAVKRLISERSITIFRKRRNLSFYVLIAFLVLVGLLILIVRLKLPRYF